MITILHYSLTSVVCPKRDATINEVKMFPNLNFRGHSRPQSPQSFRSALSIVTSGRTRFFERAQSTRFVFSANQICQNESVNHGLPVLESARGVDDWCAVEFTNHLPHFRCDYSVSVDVTRVSLVVVVVHNNLTPTSLQ